MPTGLRFSKIEKNCLSKELGVKIPINQQLSIWNESSYEKEGYIEYIGKSEFGEYDKYKIVYFVAEKISGYYKEIHIDSLLVEEDKFFFVSPDSNFLLIRASKNDSYKIVNLLKQSNLISIDKIDLDLKMLKEKLSQDKSKIKSIVGAWITHLENVNINTVAIFGADVDSSDEFEDYTSQEESTISMLIIDFSEETIAITHEYGAIFYNRRSELKLLEGYDLVKGLLSGFEMFI